MEKVLRKLGSIPFGHGVLLSLLQGYRRPNDKIADLLAKGVLLPVRRGLYVLGPEERTEPISLPLVANILYGPSYVSLEYALSRYGLIPEGVFDVTSVTLRRSRVMTNPLGRFSYKHLPQPVYGIGVRAEQEGKAAFLLASPEKALCDLIMLTRGLPYMSVAAMRSWLLEHHRMDEDILREMDRQVVLDCAAAGYKARYLRVLAKALESL
ncbi:conserved hypothetical protein [Desulfurivibrio alkaliphilus AHT 2]|uniref:Transcriptional regulator n=2 Tax=Desulfurivibrio alkaliphilus TaxID=427923 RepID=D6Z4L4_DESAT|nr:conserved hypothetical protein [Desulfurivibrio alkaliphilus AHT 2]